MADVFEYRLPARRPLIWVVLAALLTLMTVIGVTGAAWYIWAIWGGTLLLVLYMLVVNPVSGIRLTPELLTLAAWRDPKPILLRDIAMVEIQNWSDSTDMVIHLTGGERIRAYSGDMPPKARLVRELNLRRVPVQET
jgi:uncharacterized protein (DUF58 family)